MDRRNGRFQKLTDYCLSGLHRWVPENIYVTPSTGVRACRECMENRRLERMFDNPKRPRRRFWPHLSGKCRKGLHAWIPENLHQDKSGRNRCRLCRRDTSRKYNQTHPNQIMCIAANCTRHTVRQSGETYICPKHRKDPPAWIFRAGLRIVGTEVLAA